MRCLLNKLLSIIKGQSYSIDSRVPFSYLITLIFRRIFMAFWGIFIPCRKRGLFFVSHRSTIKCCSKLIVGSNVTIERGCYLDALSDDGIQLGDNVSLGKFTCIECTGSLTNIGKGFKVEDNVGLGSHCFFGCAGGIEIGKDTIFGNYVSLHSENHNFMNLSTIIRMQGVSRKGIKIGSNCWIGAKVTILDGVKMGNGCVIAAGSVIVAGDYPDNSIFAGVPAKLIKKRG